MQCAAATGAEVYVLGAAASHGLRLSRFCRKFEATGIPIDGTPREELAQAIDRCVARWGIDLVLAGDGHAARSLIALRNRIGAPCFPMPDLESFDRLNDKWRFHRIAVGAGVRTPATWLFRDVAELAAARHDGTLPRKAIAKPLSLSGSEGCFVFEAGVATEKLARIGYAPILVQEFIEGEDIGASVFCERGVVKAFIAHGYRRDTYHTFASAGIREDIEAMLGPLAVDGVFNFDMRRDANGGIHYLECNPRFFFKMAMSMLAGINFVALGLDGAPEAITTSPARTVRFPKALLFSLLTPWRGIEPESWKALRFTLADPIPYLREEMGFEQGSI